MLSLPLITVVPLAVATLLSGVNADSTLPATPTSAPPASSTPGGLTQCSSDCINKAVTSSGCSNLTDVQCICNNSPFVEKAFACLNENCPGSDEVDVLQAYVGECGSAASSILASLTATSATTSAASSATTASDHPASASEHHSSAISALPSHLTSKSSASDSSHAAHPTSTSSAASSTATSDTVTPPSSESLTTSMVSMTDGSYPAASPSASAPAYNQSIDVVSSTVIIPPAPGPRNNTTTSNAAPKLGVMNLGLEVGSFLGLGMGFTVFSTMMCGASLVF